MKAAAREMTGVGSMVGDILQPDKAKTLGVELEKDTQAIVGKLAHVTIASPADVQQAVLDRQDIGDRMKKVAAFFEPFKGMANKLHKALCAREREILAPLEAIDVRLKRAITDFNAEQARLRQAEERRQADEQRESEQRRLTDEAAALHASGEIALADAVVEQAITMPAPVVNLPRLETQVEGLKLRREWRWRPTGGDTPEGRARAMQIVPREYLCLDEKKIGTYVRGMKETGKIPGIEIYFEDVPVR